MNIDRHNYEEYFILYMDNELSSEDRRAVEVFVQQHPDLKEELDSLFQYKLAPDADVVFQGKEDLMSGMISLQSAAAPINLTNYSEWLVLYLDEELSSKDRKKVEQFIDSNPPVKKELQLLQLAKLEPETVVFPDKSSLYRKEEDDRDIAPVPIRWWRIAAAAVLLISIGITTALVVNRKSSSTSPELATSQKGLKKNEPVKSNNEIVNPQQAVTTPDDNLVADAEVPGETGTKKELDNSVAVKVKKTTAEDHNSVSPITREIIKEEPVIANVPKHNDLPKPLNNPNVIKNNDANNAIANNTNAPKVNVNQKDPLTTADVTNEKSQPSDIINASTLVTLDQPDEKKNKNRGFFRKLTRTFEKRTSMDATDDDKLLVAGLSIRLK